MGVIKSKMGTIKSKIGRKFEQKRKAKWVKKKSKFGQGLGRTSLCILDAIHPAEVEYKRRLVDVDQCAQL